jgi:hypothetical protein
MVIKPRGLRKFPSFFNRYFHSSRIALFALVVLSIASVTCPAAAEQNFALIGTWQHVQKDSITTLVFNPNGTFHTKIDIASGGSGHKMWRGTYKATSASSWVITVQA